MKKNLVKTALISISGSVAEWSKALVLGISLFGGVGSNPTAAKFHFYIMRTSVVYRLKHQDTPLKGISTSL